MLHTFCSIACRSLTVVPRPSRAHVSDGTYPAFRTGGATLIPDTRTLPHSVQLEVGRTLREHAPRTSHAVWDLVDRDPVALLEESNADRVPELVPVRYGRMLESEFAYLRGSPGVMAHDLASTPSCGTIVQACGDAHLLNFGLYGSPERNLVFDLNDFDETYLAPWEWDVKRLAVSFVVAARDVGLDDESGRSAARGATMTYRRGMLALAETPPLEVWYAHVDADDILGRTDKADRAWAAKLIAKARRR